MAPDGAVPTEVVVAIVPAKDRADRVGRTVAALTALARVQRVLVVDDGSGDATAEVARTAGAEVLVLSRNRGKAGAVRAGVERAPEADVFLLIDADLHDTAGEADRLLDPVLAGEADMTVGVLPAAGTRGGLGLVKASAARGIRRACGFEAQAPLSGQRAVRAGFLADLTNAHRFGLEVALTIDARRAGARVVEVPVPMDHRHTGRSAAGFAHRARQGIDVARALWPRLTTGRQRIALMVVAALLVVGLAVWSGGRGTPDSQPLSGRPAQVVVVAMNPLGIDDLGRGDTPNLDRLMNGAAAGVVSPATGTRRASLAERYLSLGAGYRLEASPSAGVAFDTDAELGAGTAGEALEALTGRRPDGAIAVLGAPAAVERNQRASVTFAPGALGDALERQGRAAAAVGNGDRPGREPGGTVVSRPETLAVMDRTLSVSAGTIERDALLIPDPAAPYGVRADPPAVMAAVEQAATVADVVVVDPGDLARAQALDDAVPAAERDADRRAALRRTDELLGDVLRWAPADTAVMAVSVLAPGDRPALTPIALSGPGVPAGSVTSPSTQRSGVVAITDLAPTILTALDVPVPDGMPGAAIRYEAGTGSLDRWRDLDRDTDFRDRSYYPQARWFIVAQAVIYLLVALVLARRRFPAGPVRVLMLSAAAFPLATFAFRLIPGWAGLGAAAPLLLVALPVGIGLVASRSRRHPLSGLHWVMALTVAVILVDAATGSRLHVNSWLGYNLATAGRFYGIPNTTFALLGSASLLLACGHFHYAARRREALVAVALFFGVVAVVDGLPSLGGDVGGVITLVPLFAATLLALTGRRIGGRSVVVLAAITVAAVVAVAGLDLLRPEPARTHLGRFASDLIDDGPGGLWETVVRKEGVNLRLLRSSVWTWMLPIVAGFLVFTLGWSRRWGQPLPAGSALRTGAVAVTVGAGLGFLANDSGPIVIALFLVYLLPFVGLLALDRPNRSPVLLAPSPAEDRRPERRTAAAVPT